MPAAQAEPLPAPILPAALRLGPVHLVVRDVERSVSWYGRALGLRLRARRDGGAELGDGEATAVVLHEDREARPAGRHAGLYHYALLFPTRAELARAARRVGAAQARVQGLSDHGTHEAIYLPDPDGNGIELAADRPRERWTPEQYAAGPAPLDLRSLLAEAGDEPPAPTVSDGLRVGHVHLHVGDLAEAIGFYRDVLGFELQADIGSAAFLSAGGYHHHVAVNVWKGIGVGPAPPHTVGLERWTVELPSPADVAAVRGRVEAAGRPVEPVDGGFRTSDPWEIAVAFLA